MLRDRTTSDTSDDGTYVYGVRTKAPVLVALYSSSALVGLADGANAEHCWRPGDVMVRGARSKDHGAWFVSKENSVQRINNEEIMGGRDAYGMVYEKGRKLTRVQARDESVKRIARHVW